MKDFLILYENKNREKDGIYLIKHELENRGYSVEISQIHYRKRNKNRYKVVLVPYLYEDENLYNDVYLLNGQIQGIINLRWEQVLNRREENDKNNFFYPSGEARKAYHICWGTAEASALKKIGIEEEKICLCGSVQLDLLTCDKLFMGKDRLASKYHLNVNKKWVVFISSFSYTNLLPEMEKVLVSRLGGHALDFKKISINTRNVLLKWFACITEKYENIEFVYRLHPSEQSDGKLRSMDECISNFHIIANESVDQWVYAAEKVYNWYSTSAAQVYFLGKENILLRPVHFREEEDIRIFEGASIIHNYEEFELDMCHDSLPDKCLGIERYYNKPGEAYKKVADVCEHVLKDNISCDIDYKRIKQGQSWLNRAKAILYPVYRMIMKSGIGLKIWSGGRSSAYMLSERNTLTQEEIEDLNERTKLFIGHS